MVGGGWGCNSILLWMLLPMRCPAPRMQHGDLVVKQGDGWLPNCKVGWDPPAANHCTAAVDTSATWLQRRLAAVDSGWRLTVHCGWQRLAVAAVGSGSTEKLQRAGRSGWHLPTTTLDPASA